LIKLAPLIAAVDPVDPDDRHYFIQMTLIIANVRSDNPVDPLR
jgi:hypothetical protein